MAQGSQLIAHSSRPAATAPGDIEKPEIEARFLAQREQFRHDNTIEPLAPTPDQPVTIWATSGVMIRLAGASVFYTTDGSAPGPSSTEIPMTIGRVDWDDRTGFLTRWRAEIPAQSAGTVVRYSIGGRYAAPGTPPNIWAHDGQGFWFRFPRDQGITIFAYLVGEPGPPLPAWMHDAVIYHIFLDRFHPGTDDGAFHGSPESRGRHGGTLRGVRRALPYLADLGVTCLWLSPLHPSETFHRYDTIDYFAVDPALGTESEFRSLVDEIHALGMRIWMDFVPSHASWRHPAFVEAQRDRSSPTASWFTFYQWPDRYRSFLDRARYLPSFNTADPGARAHLIESAVYWLREFGVDGYRLDHAIAPSMDFWVALRRATEDVRPDVVNVGEATDTPDSLRRYRGKLHGVLDFDLAEALRSTFARREWGVARFAVFLDAYERCMADGPGRVSFLDNHDMDRFLWMADGDVELLKMAALCQFTLDAVPAVYYGTEIGMSQQRGSREAGFGGDAQARGDMLWDRGRWNENVLAFYGDLIRLRRNSDALKHGSRRTVHADEAQGTLAYVRADERSAVLAAFNLGEDEATIEVPIEPRARPRVLVSTGETPVVAISMRRSESMSG